MSPIGESFRNRTRMYPGLVNCTTIDWFQPWPADALVEVATKFIQDIPVRQRIGAELLLFENNVPDPLGSWHSRFKGSRSLKRQCPRASLHEIRTTPPAGKNNSIRRHRMYECDDNGSPSNDNDFGPQGTGSRRVPRAFRAPCLTFSEGCQRLGSLSSLVLCINVSYGTRLFFWRVWMSVGV